MAFSELQVGPRQANDGAMTVARGDKSGALVTHAMHGQYYEAVSRGNVFWTANQSGVTSQAGLSVTTPVLTVYNPIGSGVDCSLLFAGATFLVAFAAAAIVWLAAGVPGGGADVTGTAAVVRSARVGSMQQSRVQPFLAATLPLVPVGIDILGVGLTAAITTVPQIQVLDRHYNGSVVVVPGGNISIQTSTASGTNSTACMFVWEEIPLV